MKRSLPAKTHSDIETVRLVWLGIFISVFSFLFYNRQGSVLLYGDAVAHINIARRIFDSRTPGLLQIGTVWLPLPHLLILPFIVSKQMWQSGSGGSIPSMAAFVLAVVGIFRLVRAGLKSGDAVASSRLAPWAAAILFAANPNLIYMQTTAMGESLYLAFFVWAVAYFSDFGKGNSKSLTRCALCLAAACLTRYDGWFLSAVMAGIVLLRAADSMHQTAETRPPLPERKLLIKFVLIAAAAPLLWLAFNAAVYGNPLEFANGPYSARAIEIKTATVNPAKGNLFASAAYLLKAAELNVAESSWAGRAWLALALLGSAVSIFTKRLRVALLLWTPLPFYALSIAYGSVPIFVPAWWPFSEYNVRYGLQLLPAFAVFVPLGVSFLIHSIAHHPRFAPSLGARSGAAALLCILALAGLSYAAIWRADPICLREAEVNMKGLVALDRQVGEWIKSLPPDSTLLMYLGGHVGALERAGIPLRRTINEGNHRVWRHPADPEGLWEAALADPAAYADYAVGFQGDPVWIAARAQHLPALVEIHATGQASAVIFRARPRAAGP